MMIRRQNRTAISATQIVGPGLKLWLLRIVVSLGGYQRLLGRDGFGNDELASCLGLGDLIESEDRAFSPKAALVRLRKELVAAKRCNETGAAPILSENSERIAELVGLDGIERQILEFAVMLHGERLLDDAADLLGELNFIRACHVLAVILDLNEGAVRDRLAPHGTLAKTGLVKIDHDGRYQLRSKLELIGHSFAERMMSSREDPVSLFRGAFAPVAPSELSIDDFAHIQRSIDILLPYLRHTIATERRGVNVLLYGAPGTGKNQLTRAIAEIIGLTAYEVASEDSDGDPIKGESRLRAFRAAQGVLKGKSVLLVFDEAEDVFSDGDRMFGTKSTAQVRKAWMNRSLEENVVPTIWLSNSIHGVDPAFVRRFDMAIHLDIPPKSQRRRIIQQACGDIGTEALVESLAGAEHCAPAVVVRAASIVRCVREQFSGDQAEAAMCHLVSTTLRAQGYSEIRSANVDALPTYYDPAFINADADLKQAAAGIRDAGAARICLYGPPGTGKSAFGRWLADQLGVPLIAKRASDLLSKWVGGTEQNIAKAFRDATADNALLLIDEIDSFLQDRRDANHSWEVSAVNEMLTQLESFSGVFIASTNLMTGLDQASLRRFDLKVKFDFLRADQAWSLVCTQCAALALPEPPPPLQRRVSRMTYLTPGDFAAVARQHRFRPVKDATALVDALEQECAVKESARSRAIGFHCA